MHFLHCISWSLVMPACQRSFFFSDPIFKMKKWLMLAVIWTTNKKEHLIFRLLSAEVEGRKGKVLHLSGEGLSTVPGPPKLRRYHLCSRQFRSSRLELGCAKWRPWSGRQILTGQNEARFHHGHFSCSYTGAIFSRALKLNSRHRYKAPP